VKHADYHRQVLKVVVAANADLEDRLIDLTQTPMSGLALCDARMFRSRLLLSSQRDLSYHVALLTIMALVYMNRSPRRGLSSETDEHSPSFGYTSSASNSSPSYSFTACKDTKTAVGAYSQDLMCNILHMTLSLERSQRILQI